ncbi:kelch repeat-containing protein [Ekhidna sp.]|uniref:Kelch repeat-containing protein n=1 Tax=Ekhidna sp. TaxID=2608089 RepID=UPI0032EB2EC6
MLKSILKFLLVIFFVALAGLLSIYLYWFRSISYASEKVITEKGVFTLGRDLPKARTEAGGAAIGTKMYVLGGIDSFAQTLNDFYEYNSTNDEWVQLDDIPHYVNHPGVVTDGRYLYVLGGFKPLGIRLRGFMFAEWNPYDLFFRYDPEAKKWEPFPSMPASRGGGGVCYGQGKIWYVGGIDENKEITNDLFAYDIQAGVWTEFAPMKYARDHMRMEYHSGNLYAISGRKDDLRFNLDYLEKYNIETGEWTTLDPIPTPRGGFASVLYDKKILTFGGENVWTCFDEIEAFDIEKEKWIQFDYLPEGRHGIIGGVIGNKIHLVSGGKHPRVSISDLHRIYSIK